tara:strand:+ start:22058 stop:22606 length:549 start_codon:yes stop_codon:yes gene_type:complete
MYKMSQLSILSLNPDEIQVAVRTNEVVEVHGGAVNIRMATSSEGLPEKGTNEAENFPPFNHEYKFRPQEQVLSASASNIPAILKDDIEDNEKITILKFYDKDVLAQVKRYREKGAKVSGEFSIGFESSCFSNLYQFDELEVDLFLQTKEDDGFMLFFEDIDIIEEAREYGVEDNSQGECNAD